VSHAGELMSADTVSSPSANASRSGAFFETVLKVARSASRDETRPVLTGILVRATPGAGAR
jgi:hypothetical protein